MLPVWISTRLHPYKEEGLKQSHKKAYAQDKKISQGNVASSAGHKHKTAVDVFFPAGEQK